MNVSDLKDRIITWGNAVTRDSVTVIRGRKPSREGKTKDDEVGAPRPSRPYVAVYLGARNRIGQDDDHSMGGTDGEDMIYQGHRERTVGFQCFGSNENPRVHAGDILEDLEVGMELVEVFREYLEPHDIVPVEVAGSTPQDAVAGKGWENRAQIDLIFRHPVTYSEQPGVVEKVGVESNVDGDTETQNIDMNYS